MRQIGPERPTAPIVAPVKSVTATALGCGYQDTSAFILMFRSALGVTPGRYFDRTATPTVAPALVADAGP